MPSRRQLVRSFALHAALSSLTVLALTAQHPARIVPTRLQRLLAAEDARGTGRDSIAPLLAGLQSTDTLLRRIAVRAIGRLQRPPLAPLVIVALNDAVPAIRAEAANAVAQSFNGVHRPITPQLQSHLRASAAALTARLALERDSLAANALAEALGRLPAVDSTDGRRAETTIIDHAGTMAGFGAVRGLYWLAINRRFTGGLSVRGVAALRAAAQPRPDVVVRRAALVALGLVAGLDTATVVAASRDADDQVRRLALAGVGALPLPIRAAVVERALNDSSPIVRIAAIGAARAGNLHPDCTPLVAATRDPQPHVALTAIDALSPKCADTAAASQALMELIDPSRDPSPTHRWQIQAHALLALARVDRLAVNAPLQALARSPHAGTRVYAARAAALVGDTALLTSLAGDTDHNVVEAAIGGLMRVSRHAADSVYVAALSSRGYQVVLAADSALAGSRLSGALPALLDALDRLSAGRRENARDPRIATLKRIAELGSVNNVRRLAPYLADFDTTIASTVATMISNWSGTATVAHPLPLPIRPEPLAQTFLSRNIGLAVTMADSSGGGTFTVQLFPRDAPATVARVVRLAREHYYDGHVFQRVEPNFVIQGGGPDASEYMGDATFMRDELGPASHLRGTVGISSRGRDTGDAQWFINLVDNTRLDHEYTVFGRVVSGMDVVDRILEGDVIARVEVVRAP